MKTIEVQPDRPDTHFVVLDFAKGIVVNIRDFLFARYALDGADLRLLSDHGVLQPLMR